MGWGIWFDRALGESRDAEVGDLQCAIGGEENVLGLDVPVDQSSVVRVFETVACLDSQIQSCLKIGTSAVGDPVAEVAAIQVLDDEKWHVVQRKDEIAVGDMGMHPESCPRLGLGDDPVAVIRVLQDLILRGFDNQIDPPPFVMRDVDGRHAAIDDLLYQVGIGNALADAESRQRSTRRRSP
jgi:hypothetical protein